MTEAFRSISDAYRPVRGTARAPWSSAPFTFASNWLARASRLFPDGLSDDRGAARDIIQLLIDFTRDEVDVGIRSGGGKWPGLAAHQLLRAGFSPMLSPQLAASAGIHEPADLLKLPLLLKRQRPLVGGLVRSGRRHGPARSCHPAEHGSARKL